MALAESGALPAETARALLGGLLELHAIPAAEFPWQAELGDAFNSREAELVRRIGSDAAGWLSAGRPRREAFRVALRACSRRGAAELASALADCAGALAAHARALRDALAADYTYLQAAQPTTAGHLLLAYAYPALRDAERLRHAHRELSRSVAGRRRQRRLALAARPRCAWPSCSAATGSSRTRRTPPGSGTSTPSCSRRSRSRPRTSPSSRRTSRSTRATSSA